MFRLVDVCDKGALARIVGPDDYEVAKTLAAAWLTLYDT